MAKKRTGRPKIAPDTRKGLYLQVRIDHEERDLFAQAASAKGLGVSAWARLRLRESAKKDLKDAGAESH